MKTLISYIKHIHVSCRRFISDTNPELEGNIVISVGLFGHSGDDEVWDGMDKGALSKTKEMLDDMHKRKIDMADEIFVINVGGYMNYRRRKENMTIDIEELREALKQECYGAFFAGGFGGALMESFDIDRASPEELVSIALRNGIELSDYECDEY